MPDHVWPTREEWAADAERSTRQSCYARQRVSDRLSDWATTAEREHLAHIARAARLAAGRAVKALERDDDVAMAQINLTDLHRLIRMWDHIQERMTLAGEQAENDAVAKAVEHRRTDEGWAQELASRILIEADWMTFRDADGAVRLVSPRQHRRRRPIGER